ncbi:DUF7373 family lipoprotein [Nocardia sp. bgisy134]|uniref:DUF7373 family lipoprotein n=1 Tax=unclassified Nocardia TaxID=2637762 RepID=UPI003D706AD7
MIATTVALTAACGDNDNRLDEPAVDISKLDSGNYPTAPRDVNATRTDKTGLALEAMRIGNAFPLAYDVDRKYAYMRLIYPDPRLSSVLRGYIPHVSSLEEFSGLTEGLIAGWETNGERRRSPSLGRQVVMKVMRFGTAAQAETAAQRIADRQAETTAGERVTIPDHPQVRARWSESKRTLDSWLTRDTLLLYTHIEDPVTEPSETAPLIDFTTRAFNTQLEMLKGYTPTPVDQLASLPMDPEGLLGRTLPLEDKEKYANGEDPSTVGPKQTALHREHRPDRMKAAFDDAGVDLVANAAGRLYRTENAASTVRLIAALIDQASEGYKSIDGPPNLPSAKCFEAKSPKISTDRYPPVCYFAYDRYVARVQGKNIQELHQKAAAQYKLLAHDR